MKNFKVGLQLYSIAGDMEADMDAALKKVKEIGYDYVEFAGYVKFAGFYGKSAEEIKAILDKYELECVSVHLRPDIYLEEGQRVIDYVKTLGTKYSAVPWYDKEKLTGTAGWNNTVELFNKVGKLLKENDIQMLYHNHNFEFEKVDNKLILDWIYETIPADLLQPQVDTCWVHYAGYNPAEYLLKYAGRIEIVHLKDFVCKNLDGSRIYEMNDREGDKDNTSMEANGFEFCPIGSGIQDIPAILDASEKAGAEIIIVEQDNSLNIPPIEAAKISREYLKSLGI